MYCDDGIVEFWENQRFWGLTWGAPLLPFDWPAFSDAAGNAVQLARPPEREGERGWFVVRTLGTDEEGWRYSTVFSKITTPRPGGRASKRSSDYVRNRLWRKLAVQADPPDRELSELFYPSGRGGTTAAGAGDAAGASSGEGQCSGSGPAGDLPALATSGAAGAAAAAASAAAAALAAAAPSSSRPPPPRLQPEAERILLSAVAAAGISASGGRGGGGSALPKPSLFKLWQLFLELWNDACARHGMRRLVPLDPLGLYVASRRHRGLLARQQRSQLAAGRLVAAVPLATEVEPDVLDAQQEAAAQEAAAAAGAAGATGAGTGSRQVAEAAVAAATAAAAAMAHQHLSPTVGETPTGAAITQPKAPEPATLHRGIGGAAAIITGPPGSAAASGGAAAAGGGDTLLTADQGLMPDLSDPATLLGELMVATNYARAAYGYPMAAGHLASLAKLITMFGSSAHFNPITGASAEANLEAIHLFTGIPVEDVVMAEWRSSVFRPCHYLAVDRRRRRLVLAVRGSLELADIATDLTARPMEFDFGDGLVGHVHQGLMSAASYVQLNTAAALRSAAERFPGWPLLVTGHSLGAGVAALLTLLLRQRSRPMAAPAAVPVVHCLAIAPPAVLSSSLATAARECVVSVVLAGDFVARLSCYSVDRALLELVQASPAAQMADNLLQSTGATWAAIQQRLAALGGAAAGSGGGGSGGGSSGGAGGPFGFLAGGGAGGRGGNGEGQRYPPRGMEVELVPTCAGLKDIPLLTAAGAGAALPGEAGSPRHRHRHHVPHHRYLYHHTHHTHQQQHPSPGGLGQQGPSSTLQPAPPPGDTARHHHNHHNRHSHQHQQDAPTSHPLSAAPAAAGPAAEAAAAAAHSDPDDDAVSARSDSGDGADVEDGAEDEEASYVTAASPHESYLSAASSPASRLGGASSASVTLEEAVESGFLYRATHPTAAAAVGGVPYAAHGAAGAQSQRHATAARAIPAPMRPGAGGAAAAADAVDRRFAALTPPATSPEGNAGGFVASAAAAGGWNLGLFGGGTPPAGPVAAAAEFPPLGLRRSSDPLAARGALYRQVEADDAEAVRRAGRARAGQSRRRARSRSRGASGGEGSGGGGNGDSLLSWEALSHKLMTSWFGKGFFDDEEDEEEEGAGAAVEADNGNSGGGGFGSWLAAVTGAAGSALLPGGGGGGDAARGAGSSGNGDGGGRSGLTSCWPGLEEPPGPHRHQDAAAAALRGKYGAPGLGSIAWPWPDQPPEQRPQPQAGAAMATCATPAAGAGSGGDVRAERAGPGISRPGHSRSRSAPAVEVPDVSDAVPSDSDEAGLPPPGRAHNPHHHHHHQRQPPHATSPASGGATGVSSGPEGGAAAAPHYLHSVHKELYPPGRLLWIVVDELDALPPRLRTRLERAAAAAPGGQGPGDGAAEAATAEACRPAAAAAAAEGRGEGDRCGVGGSGDSDGARQDAAPAPAQRADSYGLLDLCAVTDMVHGLVVGSAGSARSDGVAAPASGSGCPAGQRAVTRPGSANDGQGGGRVAGGSGTASAPVPVEASRAAAAAAGCEPAGTAFIADAPSAAAEALAQGGSSKRPRVSFCGDGWTDVAEESLAAAQCISSPFGVGSGSLGGRTAPASPPLLAADSGGSGGSTPFTTRVREGLKRIKSGVETMLKQAPLPNVASVPFLPGVAAAAAAAAAVLEDATAPASEASSRAAERAAEGSGGGGAAAVAGGQWVFLVEAEREVFERMVLIPACFTDHLPDAYVQRLRQLAKGAVLPSALGVPEGGGGGAETDGASGGAAAVGGGR